VSDLDPEFLELADVFELHADSIASYGGDLGVRDRGLTESAVAVPGDLAGSSLMRLRAGTLRSTPFSKRST
jgi:hypothetical protein